MSDHKELSGVEDKHERRDRDRKDKEKDKDKDKEKEKDGKDKEKKKKSRRSHRSKSRSRSRSRSRSKKRSRRSPTPPPMDPQQRKEQEKMQAFEIIRDKAEFTIFCSQIFPKVDERDLFDFFSYVGTVTDVRLIRDQRTGKSKGLCYVEFEDRMSVAKALALNGQLIGGYPIHIQQTSAAVVAAPVSAANSGGYRIYVGSLPYNITDGDIRPLFEAVGEVLQIDILRDNQTGQSKGFGFVHYRKEEDAKLAMATLDGTIVLGRPIKVSEASPNAAYGTSVSVSAQPAVPAGGSAGILGGMGAALALQQGGQQQQQPGNSLANMMGMQMPVVNERVGNLDDDRAGLALNAQSRAQLMARLSRGDMPTPAMPTAAAPVSSSVPSLSPTGVVVVSGDDVLPTSGPVVPTNCVIVRNMFDPRTETDPEWDRDIREDVEDEVSKYGRLDHIYVDKTHPKGYVFLKFQHADAAQGVVKTFHGRWFASRQITADYVVEATYYSRFPEAKK